MKKKIISSILIIAAILIVSSCRQPARYHALIITGQNNHNWKVSSLVLKQILEETGLFSVKIETTPSSGKKMDSFNPDFSKYNVVVLDYNGDAWSENTNKAFLSYVHQGGGVVVYHASNNAFPEWKEYNKVIGLGGWGDRTEKDGPYVYYKKDSLIIDNSPGEGGAHGTKHEFVVINRKPNHPVTKGLPLSWMHAKDELYSRLRGPAQSMEVLATAYADTAQNGTGRDEPILFTVSYGKGRIFQTVLGDTEWEGPQPALECAGFITTFQRGAEWAATGGVTQLVPVDFPNSVSVVQWENFKQLTFDEVLDKIKSYKMGRSRKYIVSLQERIRKAHGSQEILHEYEKGMVKLLESSRCSDDAKKALLHELSWMGSSYCLPVLKRLKNKDGIKDEVQYAMSRLVPDKKE